MNPKEPKVTNDPDALLHTESQVAKHPLVRSSLMLVQAVKRASAGKPDSPFTGRITTARKFNEWILTNKWFVQSHWTRKKRTASADASTSHAQSVTA